MAIHFFLNFLLVHYLFSLKLDQMDHWSIIGHFGTEEKKMRGFKLIKKHLHLLKTLQ